MTGCQDYITLFHASVNSDDFILDPFEIEKGGWFEEEDFPELGPSTKLLWKKFKEHRKD